jgi:ABC-type transporter Mla MlaB component
MVISSRTPEGQPNHCPVCDSDLTIEPFHPAGDAPCPSCGNLLWFRWEELGDARVFKPGGDPLRPEALNSLFDSVAAMSHTQTVLDLSEVDRLSSACLARLIDLKKAVRTVGGQLTVRHLHADLLEIFRVTRLD